MIKVSVIVPIYNSEKYLKKCLDSLVNQTLKEMEFILINDGSTDASEDIITSYHDKRIKYFKQENMGIGATRNRGIKEAKGEYIAFLDSDDYMELDAFLEMYKEASKRNLDIILGDFYQEEDNQEELIKLIDFSDTSLLKSPNLLMDIPLAPWNKLYKRNLIEDCSFPINLKYEDTPFVAKMFSKANRIGKINKPFTHYVIHSKSETTTIDKRVFDILKISDILLKDLGDNKNIRSYVEDLIIYLITKYTISMRYVKDKNLRNSFIDEAFNYLNNNVSNYKNSNYFKQRNILKRIIETNKTLTKLYCSSYIMFKNVK